MQAQVMVSALFAGVFGVLSGVFAIAEVLLLREFDQGLPAAGLLAAGVAAYAAGLAFARRTGMLPQRQFLLCHVLLMALALVAMHGLQPLIVSTVFGSDAPLGTLLRLPQEVQHGFLVATWFLTLAAFRAGARYGLERAAQQPVATEAGARAEAA